MNKLEISEEINQHRRHFFSTAAMTIAAGMVGSATAQSKTSSKFEAD